MVARSPEDCDRLFGECVNAGDLEGLLTLYEPDAVLVSQDGSVASGRDAIRDVLAGLVEAGGRIHMEVVRVVRAGDDLALLYNDWSFRATGETGPVAMSGRALEFVRRQADGSWRFAIDDPYARG